MASFKYLYMPIETFSNKKRLRWSENHLTIGVFFEMYIFDL